MKRGLLFFISFLCWAGVFAQTNPEDDESLFMDPAAIEMRNKMTIPPYGLDKVKALIAKIIPEEDKETTDAGTNAISATDFKKLSLREKFTYTMIHAELYAQNCAIPEYQTQIDKKIFGTLLDGFNESSWSQRQTDFLQENRDSVIKLIQESVIRSKRMGVNYKHALVELNGWQMIPFIIEYAKKTPKDKDALTLLMLLMKRGEYSEFIKSTSFKKLYGENSNYYSYLNYNKENEALIFSRALKYYDEKKSK
ncbi:hypothetical protein [Sphingobacterium sp. UME9]|uniref:hypothetical protein n=1 Tax=Sphingobacterium sp. UME9 TaxID=1862316 RepID=UPI001602F042|nr:hypothetical protein [Sphingobacterium sp. UME9]MBB1645354.1 hypothetical protein [Sphingobacterium sp. UME9]